MPDGASSQQNCQAEAQELHVPGSSSAMTAAQCLPPSANPPFCAWYAIDRWAALFHQATLHSVLRACRESQLVGHGIAITMFELASSKMP
jgi:hypothetical protein